MGKKIERETNFLKKLISPPADILFDLTIFFYARGLIV